MRNETQRSNIQLVLGFPTVNASLRNKGNFVKRLSQFGLSVSQFSLAAWIGAASLFVIITVAQIKTGKMTSDVLDQLSLIKFPIYYKFGFTLIIASLIGSILAFAGKTISGVRAAACVGLIALAAILMTVDVYTIYGPLEKMIDPPGQARTAEFQSYHEASKNINTLGLVICLVAEIGLLWPWKKP